MIVSKVTSDFNGLQLFAIYIKVVKIPKGNIKAGRLLFLPKNLYFIFFFKIIIYSA
jgi:hypothetical protein